MRLLLNARHHVNMGHYEHMELVGTVEVDTNLDAELLKHLWVDPTDPDEIEKFIHERLQSLVAPDMEDAHFWTAEKKSYAHEYYKEHSKEGDNDASTNP